MRHGKHFFSKPPLNQETLARRRLQFLRSPTRSAALVLDYVLASRRVQDMARQTGNHGQTALGTVLKIDGLSLPLQLENALWLFLKEFWPESVVSPKVVQTYLQGSRHFNVAQACELVTEHYTKESGRAGLLTPVQTLVHHLLRRGDFHSCFRLVDQTVAHRDSVQQKMGQLQKLTTLPVLLFASAALAELLHQYATPTVLGWAVRLAELGLLGAAGVSLGTLLVQLVFLNNLSRVHWRPHTSLAQRWARHHEAVLANKIVLHYEEHAETNARNYHTASFRQASPHPASDQGFEKWGPDETDTRHDLRAELARRKLIWLPLKEEHVFLEFWMSHGENFEWVEPDQDPAEMISWGPNHPEPVAEKDLVR